jgi:hypothetical protein
MSDNGKDMVAEDVSGIRMAREYVKQIYDRHVQEQGGADESDAYTRHLGQAIDSLGRAIKDRSEPNDNKQPAEVAADVKVVKSSHGFDYELIAGHLGPYSSPVIGGWGEHDHAD